MEIKITDNSEIVLDELSHAMLRALEQCRLVAEGYAKK